MSAPSRRRLLLAAIGVGTAAAAAAAPPRRARRARAQEAEAEALRPGHDGLPVRLSDEDRALALDDPRLPRAGAADGDAVLVELSDFRCPHCRRSAAGTAGMAGSDPALAVAWAPLPLLGPASRELARLGLAAHAQGRYLEWHLAVMTRPGRVEPRHADALARELGLDARLLRRDAASPEVAETLRDSEALAARLGIRGTPSLLLALRAPGGAARLLEGARAPLEIASALRLLRASLGA